MAPELLKGIGLSALGTYGFSLGNMISARHQRRGLDIFSTNTYAMTYGALLMALIAWRRAPRSRSNSAAAISAPCCTWLSSDR